MALNFDTASSERYVDTGWTDPVAAPLMMSCWFSPDTTTQNEQYMLSIHDFDDVRLFNLGLDWTFGAGQGLRAAKFESGWAGAETGNTWDVTAWNHGIGFFMDAGTTRMISVLNGDWTNRGTSTDTKTPPNISHLAIGAQAFSSGYQNHFDGGIDHVAIWDTAGANDTERQAIATALNAGESVHRIRRADLKGYWILDTDGATMIDVSGNGNNLTRNGTPTLADGPPVRPFWFDAGWRGAFTAPAVGGDPEGSLMAGKLLRGGLLTHGVLTG